MIGLSYGYGIAKIEGGQGRLVTDWEWGPAPQLRVAHGLGKGFVLGLEQQAWFDEQGIYEYRVRASSQALCATLTYSPGRPESVLGGLYFQVGTGVSNSRLVVLESLPPDPSRPSSAEQVEEAFKKDETGPAYLVGMGYEFRISRAFAPGVSISYNHLSVDDQVYQKVRYWPFALHLNWYF